RHAGRARRLPGCAGRAALVGLKIAGRLFYGPFVIEKIKLRANQHRVVFAIVAKRGEPWNPDFRLVHAEASPPGGIVLAEHPARAGWSGGSGELQVYLLDLEHAAQADADAAAILHDIHAVCPPPDGAIALS